MGNFKPDEVTVKTTDKNIIVHGTSPSFFFAICCYQTFTDFYAGKHEERTDEHGFVSREFRRRVAIPKGVNPESVTSTLTPDGQLTIMAPKLALEGGMLNDANLFCQLVLILIFMWLQEPKSALFPSPWLPRLDQLAISRPSNRPKLLKSVE